jgi:diguanylate cyclase (GGDEF)-like protein/PAS domain S-box-containing protein
MTARTSNTIERLAAVPSPVRPTGAASREHESMLAEVAGSIDRAIVITDPQLHVVYTNGAFTALFGFTAAEVAGRPVHEVLMGPTTDRRAVARLLRQLRREGRGEADLLTFDSRGEEIWSSAHVNAVRGPDGQVRYLVGLLADIGETQQLRSLQQLILSALADDLPITEIADRLCRRVEQLAPDVVSSLLHVDADGLLHPLGGPSLPEHYSRALDGVAIGVGIGSCGTAAALGVPVLAENIDTDLRWQPFKAAPMAAGLRACWSTPIKAKDGRVIATFAFYFRECRGPSRWHQRIVEACVHLGALAIERKEARAQIARLAYHDALTGLPNRARLRELILAALRESPDDRLALIFLDLDHFKDINDSLGHAAGDAVLVQLTQRLRAQLRPGDLLGRLSGDEFVIVLPQRDAEAAGQTAMRITAALLSPLDIGERQVAMTASMGISVYPDTARGIDALMQQADAAMYRVKQSGRSGYRFFSADMNRLADQRLAYSAALRRAIAGGALRLHYQPQVRVSDGMLCGVEALARWIDPVLGEVSPAIFIPLAEECGLIEQLGLWSLRESCRQFAEWRAEGLAIGRVSVNLSPLNFQKPGLAAAIAEILAEHGVPASALMLELTESIAMDTDPATMETMRAIRALGVGLSLDDFGTGYSSLSRLGHLPIGELKIDRSFIQAIDGDASALAIVTAMIRVGQSLGMTVLAEGVENERQRETLARLGCDMGQGFLYAAAMAPAELGGWMLAHAGRLGAMLGRVAAQAQQPRRIETWQPDAPPLERVAARWC